MHDRLRKILIVAAALAAVGLAAAGQGKRPAVGRPSAGSVSRQLILKYRLQKILDGTLTASLQHNRQEWRRLSPDQRDKYRRDALAFLSKSDDQQRLLLGHYENLARLSAEKHRAHQRRAKWLKAVVASFTPAERNVLRDLPPEQRARRLLARRDQLIRQGKLTPEPAKTPATSAAATQPASVPAAED